MKKATADLFKQYLEDKKFAIEPTELGLEFRHDLTDDEIRTIVETEYSKSLTQSVDDLFLVIIKDLIKTGLEYAKADMPNSDKLSDL